MLTRLDVEFLIRKCIISCVHLIFRPPLDRRRKTSWHQKDSSINSGSVGHLIFRHRDRETWYQYRNRWSSKGLQNKASKHSSYWFTSSWAVFQFTVTHFMLSAYLYGPRLLKSHVPRFIYYLRSAGLPRHYGGRRKCTLRYYLLRQLSASRVQLLFRIR